MTTSVGGPGNHPVAVPEHRTVKCNRPAPFCGKTDDHPKSVIHVGTRPGWNGQPTYHPLDEDQDGYLEFHLDCLPEEFLGRTNDHPDHIAAAESGTHGEDLRQLIQSTPVADEEA